MKRYKIMVTTIQGNTYFFCCWKMGNKYNLRLVILQAESIFYMEDELPIIEQYLNKNLERLQIKNFSILEVTHQPHSLKARKRDDAEGFRSDNRRFQGFGPIL